MKTVRYDPAADEELIDEVARYELRRDDLDLVARELRDHVGVPS